MVLINDIRFGKDYFLNREGIYELKSELSPKHNTITLLWEDNNDIVAMLMAVEAIRDEVRYEASLDLVMPYIPYSAMDRRINDQLPTCEYMANIINRSKFDQVYVLDPHSNVAVTKINRLKEMDIQPIVDKVINEVSPDFIYYPDKGAYNKYPNIIDTHNIPVFHGYKFRDLQNKGKLSPEMQVDLCGIPIEKLKGSKVLIVDDICRKGGTAYYAAKNLKSMGVESVYLYVSHCEDCIEQGEIFKTDEIDRVFTTDSEYRITKVEDRQTKLLIIHNFRKYKTM